MDEARLRIVESQLNAQLSDEQQLFKLYTMQLEVSAHLQACRAELDSRMKSLHEDVCSALRRIESAMAVQDQQLQSVQDMQTFWRGGLGLVQVFMPFAVMLLGGLIGFLFYKK